MQAVVGEQIEIQVPNEKVVFFTSTFFYLHALISNEEFLRVEEVTVFHSLVSMIGKDSVIFFSCCRLV